MTKFRTDNTDGYSIEELALINDAWDKLTAHDHLLGMDDDTKAQTDQYRAEQLLHHFDAGLRGADLLWAMR